MKKMLGLIAGLISMTMVLAAMADDKWGNPIFHSYTSTNTSLSTTWTNEWGQRMVLQSLYLSGKGITNSTAPALSLCNYPGVTNTIPLSMTSNVTALTYYWVPSGSVTLEQGGTIALSVTICTNGTGTINATNVTVLSVYGTFTK